MINPHGQYFTGNLCAFFSSNIVIVSRYHLRRRRASGPGRFMNVVVGRPHERSLKNSTDAKKSRGFSTTDSDSTQLGVRRSCVRFYSRRIRARRTDLCDCYTRVSVPVSVGTLNAQDKKTTYTKKSNETVAKDVRLYNIYSRRRIRFRIEVVDTAIKFRFYFSHAYLRPVKHSAIRYLNRPPQSLPKNIIMQQLCHEYSVALRAHAKSLFRIGRYDIRARMYVGRATAVQSRPKRLVISYNIIF